MLALSDEEIRAEVVALLGREPDNAEPMTEVLLEAIARLSQRLSALERSTLP